MSTSRSISPTANENVSSVLLSRYLTASAATGGGAALLGVVALLGWATGFEHGFLTSGALMKPNAGVCFVFLGTALLLSRGGRLARHLSAGLATATIVLAVATLAEWLLGIDLRIDQLLFRDDTFAYTSVPGRIAPNTALAFALYGAAFLLQRSARRPGRWWLALSWGGITLGAIGGAGHLYGVSRLFAVAQRTGMAMPAAVGLVALGCGLLFARPDDGPHALLVSDGPGGTLVRWLLPTVAITPLVLALPAQIGVRLRVLDQAYASALVTVGLTGALVWVVFTAARAVDVRDAARRERERENVRLNEQLQRRAWELAVVNRELESFSYSVSHDLRSPLRSIDGFGQALLEDCSGSLPPAGHEHIRRIRAATQRMGQLIDDLLQLSRVTRTELRREPVNLSSIAAELAAELAHSAPERAVQVDIEDELVVHADPHLMRVMLENLLRNAWKFTSRHASARVVFRRCERNGKPAFFVQDDGAGFDMAYASKLFGAFQRLHGATEFPGSGIGLATVQRIIHRHGGDVWAEGAVEQGAKFTFTVPAEGRELESAA